MTELSRKKAVLFVVVVLSSTIGSYGSKEFIFSETLPQTISKGLVHRRSQRVNALTDGFEDHKPFSPKQGNFELPEVEHHEDLGGNAASPPCCVYSSHDTHDCFILGKDNMLYHMVVGSEEHPGWRSLNRVAVGELECLKVSEGKALLLAIGEDNFLVSSFFIDNQFQGIKSTGAFGLLEVPSCVAVNANKIDCMYRGVDGISYKLMYYWGYWLPPICVGGKLSSPVGCIFDNKKGLECFSAKSNHRPQIFCGFWMFRGWWPLLVGNKNILVQDRPSVITEGNGAIEVFTVDISNDMWRKSWNEDGSQNDWENIGGELGSRPECLSFGYSHVACFAVNYASYFMFNTYVIDRWSGWKYVEWGMEGPPSCFQSARSIVTCFVRGAITASIYEVKLKV